MIELPPCSNCKGPGPFCKSKRSPTGFMGLCKKCNNERVKQYAADKKSNPDPVDPNKICKACGSKGPFYKASGRRDGYDSKCIECCKKDPSRQPEAKRLQAKTHRQNNPEYWKVKDAAERIKYKERRKDNWLTWAYGITLEERDRLLAAQNNACAICLKELATPVVDHAHSPDKTVRGILCKSCNSLLGMLKDTISNFQRAISYLTKDPLPIPLLADSAKPDWSTTTAVAAYQFNHRLKTKYGINAAQFLWIKEHQGSKCPICEIDLPEIGSHLDHSHVDGEVRGVLCNPCNVALGQAKDSPVILSAAIEYLQRHLSMPRSSH